MYIYIYIHFLLRAVRTYVRTQIALLYNVKQDNGKQQYVRTWQYVLRNRKYHMGAYHQQMLIFLACRCPCVRTHSVCTYVRTRMQHARTYRCAGINNSPLDFKIRLDSKPAGSYFILGGTPEIHNTSLRSFWLKLRNPRIFYWSFAVNSKFTWAVSR